MQDIETEDGRETKTFCISLSCLIISVFFVASESHREVYASLGIPPQQGVYVCEDLIDFI